MSDAEDPQVASCDFLLATRIQYESRRKALPSPRAAPEDAAAPAPAAPADLRAADFLIATRLRDERRRAVPPEPPD